MSSTLWIWTVYAKGTDGDEHNYTARLFAVDAGGSQPTGDTMQAPELAVLRSMFRRMGLYQLSREPSDEHHIIESWL